MEVVERRIGLVSGAVVALAMAVHYYRSISHDCYTVVAGIITATVTHWQLQDTHFEIIKAFQVPVEGEDEVGQSSRRIRLTLELRLCGQQGVHIATQTTNLSRYHAC